VISDRIADPRVPPEQSVTEYLATAVSPYRTLAGDGFGEALELARACAERVPAYRQLLARYGISAPQDREGFDRLPMVDKASYLRPSKLDALSDDGALRDCHIASVSSGSTGDAYFWPRGLTQEIEGAHSYEFMYRDLWHADTKRTLVVLGFAMGTYIAGSYTLAGSIMTARKGLDIIIVTPGINREEFLRAVAELGPQFDQTVLIGYPPYIRDMIDEGAAQGIPWASLNLKMMFAGEGFTETWREHLVQKAGVRNPLRDTVSIYGSADAGILGHETPLTVAIRKFCDRNPETAVAAFGRTDLPTLVQYVPHWKYFEAVDGELVFTSRAGIPLVRYNIHDSGGVWTFADLVALLRTYGFDAKAALAEAGCEDTLVELPFVYLFGRSDFTVTLYGANIYPENVKAALEKPELRDLTSGKFVLQTIDTEAGKPQLHVHVELAVGVAPTTALVELFASATHETLLELNAEYRELEKGIGATAYPVVELHGFQSSAMFEIGAKHRYLSTKKTGE